MSQSRSPSGSVKERFIPSAFREKSTLSFRASTASWSVMAGRPSQATSPPTRISTAKAVQASSRPRFFFTNRFVSRSFMACLLPPKRLDRVGPGFSSAVDRRSSPYFRRKAASRPAATSSSQHSSRFSLAARLIHHTRGLNQWSQQAATSRAL